MAYTDHQLRNHLGQRVNFAGELIAEADSWREGSVRWTELSLYRKAGGGYVLHRLGQSLVYHRHGSDCRRGTPTEARELPVDAVPCLQCKPPRGATEVPADGCFDLEEELHNIDVCLTPQDVVNALLHPAHGRAGEPSLSAPARRLLELAAERDDGIAAVTVQAVVNL